MRAVYASVLLSAGAVSGWADAARAGVVSSFHGIGILSGDTSSTARGLSMDGSVVAGTSGSHATRYAGGVLSSLGVLDASSDPVGIGYGVSGNGTVIVGEQSTFGGSRAFRWTSGGGMQNLGTISGGGPSYAHAASMDGLVIVGGSNSLLGQRAFRWTSLTGMVSLGVLAGHTESAGTDVSSDGSVVVGRSGPFGNGLAFRWTAAGGMQSLGALAAGANSIAVAVSSDGTVVAGSSSLPGSSNHAFRWTQAGGGMLDLGTLPGGANSRAEDISGDGSAVVGVGSSPLGQRAFLWSFATGMIDLNAFLPQQGLDLSGWQLTEAIGISGDGSTISGVGTHMGHSEGWVAVLPGPGAAAVVVIGLGVVCPRRAGRPGLASQPGRAG